MELTIEPRKSKSGIIIYDIYNGDAWLAAFADPNDAEMFKVIKQEQFERQQQSQFQKP